MSTIESAPRSIAHAPAAPEPPQQLTGRLKQYRSAFTGPQLIPVLRAIVAADLHNLVFQRDWRIVPALLRQTTVSRDGGHGGGEDK
ncbi:hypothetical protein ACIGW1_07015 [Streptomyces sp. NPDC053780]|uniref:hypothetical protein n=1 Tax=unclassified Streptomyces TaxID=2593676 RepID=UPI00342E84A2